MTALALRVLIVPADRSTPEGYAYSLGDALLTDALAARFEQAGWNVSVADFGDHQRVDSPRRQLFGLRGLFKACRSSDLVVIGGGTLIQDDAAASLLGGLPRLCLAAALLSRIAGRTVVFFAVGVDPVERCIPRLMLRAAVRLAHRIYVRDLPSLGRLQRQIKAGRRARLAADAALLLTEADSYPDGQPVTAPRRGAVLALNREDAARLTARSVSGLIAQYGGVRFLSMDQGEAADWRSLKPDVAELMSNDFTLQAHWRAALDEIARAEVVFASRMHALYLGLLTQTSSVAVGSAPKVVSFAQEFVVPLVGVDALGGPVGARCPDQRPATLAAQRVEIAFRQLCDVH